MEPDKCIAAWLIKTHVNTNAVFELVPQGTKVARDIPFDVPGSRYVRDQRRSTSEVVIDIHNIKDAKAIALGVLARKLELGFWHASFTKEEAPLAQKLMELWNDQRQPKLVLEDVFTVLDRWGL